MSPVLVEQYRAIADSLVGPVDWRNDVKGFCSCPGRAFHTSASTRRDCVVYVDPNRAPSIFCVHQSCADVLALHNRALRSGCGKAKWAHDRGAEPDVVAVRPSSTPEEQARLRRKRKTERLASRTRRGAATLLADHPWPAADIQSPHPLDTNPAQHWESFLGLFELDDTVWIGGLYDSGDPAHAANFRTVRNWLDLGAEPPAGPLASASVFRPGCHDRTRENVLRTPFFVVESDTLDRVQILAVFRFLRERMMMPLRAIIDTGGRSLHGWFNRPKPGPRFDQLLVVLQALGCDPGPWREPSMSRLPGAWRVAATGEACRQRLLWLDPPDKRGGAGEAI